MKEPIPSNGAYSAFRFLCLPLSSSEYFPVDPVRQAGKQHPESGGNRIADEDNDDPLHHGQAGKVPGGIAADPGGSEYRGQPFVQLEPGGKFRKKAAGFGKGIILGKLIAPVLPGYQNAFDGGHEPDNDREYSHDEKPGSSDTQKGGYSEEHKAGSLINALNAGIEMKHILEIESAGFIKNKSQKKKGPEKPAVGEPQGNEKTAQ